MIRININNVEHKLTFSHLYMEIATGRDQFTSIPVQTVCRLFPADEPEMALEGVANLHPADNPNKAIGRGLALKRVLERIEDKQIRKEIGHAVNNAGVKLQMP